MDLQRLLGALIKQVQPNGDEGVVVHDATMLEMPQLVYLLSLKEAHGTRLAVIEVPA
jgi:hypothetical protein